MADVLLAVLDGRRFDAASLGRAARAQWSGVGFSPSTGELAQSSVGQVEIRRGVQSIRIVVLAGGAGLGVEGDDELAVDVLAWLTRLDPVRQRGTVMMTDWSADPVELEPDMSRSALLALRDR